MINLEGRADCYASLFQNQNKSLCWFQNWKNMKIPQNQKMYKVNKPDFEEAQFLANLCEVLWLTFVFLSSAGLSFSSRLKKIENFCSGMALGKIPVSKLENF